MSIELKEILLLLDRIYLLSQEHLSEFFNKSFTEIEKILGILILERLVGNINSTSILLREIQNNPNVEPAVGLILRNNLSLCKIVFKHSELRNNSTELKEFYKSIFGENLKRTIKDIKKTYTQKEIQPSLDNIKGGYAFILKTTGLNIDNIEEERFTSNFKLSSKFDSLENLFVAYSKYEHFGLNTLILQGNNVSVEELERIYIAIHYSLQGILTCLLMLQIVDNDLISINNELSENA